MIDKQEELSLRSSRVFLVGRVLSQKPINKENFKRQMQSLWRPKESVLIVELKGDLFAFGFNTKHDRTMIHRGGPWLYNKQALLLLAEADDITHPTRIPLMYQEFWVQIKGLPLCYMTRKMGKFIGNHLDEYVLTDQSRKDEQFGSILQIRTRVDATKPYRRNLALQLGGQVVDVAASYEKLYFTCFLCGMMDHLEEQCGRYKGKNGDDLSKPYGRWFQEDTLSSNYRKPPGQILD